MAKQHSFVTSKSGKEFPARFGGLTLTYEYPENMAEVRALVADGVDQDQAIYGKVMGQGIHLDIQKDMKGALAGEPEGVTWTVEEATEAAQKAAREYRIGAPRARTAGGSAKVRAERAEAKAAEKEQEAAAARSSMADLYRQAPAAFRKVMRADLIAREIFTEEELTELEK